VQSKNKPAMTKAERAHVARLAQMECVVCGEHGPSQVHEFEQGQWFTSVPLCAPCHTGPQGWHGTRFRWARLKMDMLKAINETLKRLAA